MKENLTNYFSRFSKTVLFGFALYLAGWGLYALGMYLAGFSHGDPIYWWGGVWSVGPETIGNAPALAKNIFGSVVLGLASGIGFLGKRIVLFAPLIALVLLFVSKHRNEETRRLEEASNI